MAFLNHSRVLSAFVTAGLLVLPGGQPALAQSARQDLPVLLNGTLQPARADVSVQQAATVGQRPPATTSAPTLSPRTAFPTQLGTNDTQLRPVVRDGDLNYPPQPEAPRDGMIDLRGPVAPTDGADPTQFDQRSAEDIAAFDNPPAGFDPLLFQIEDIAPALDRRPRRLFGADPFAPVGVRLGSFVLFPEIEIGGTGFTNVFSTPDAYADAALDLRPSARLVSNWSNHAVELRGSADVSSHSEFQSEDERGYELEARGRLDITRATNLQGLMSRQLAQETRSAIDAASIGDRADITTDTARVTLNHRFNRLRVELRGAVTDTEFGDVSGAGLIASNTDRNVRQRSGAVRLSWEFKPTLSVFSEVEGQDREFETVAASDGIRRDSTGGRYRAGVSFGETAAVLRGEIGFGYAHQDLDDARLVDVKGITLDANLAWRVNALTRVLFTASSDVADTTNLGSGGVLYRQAGLEVRHAFRRNVIATAGLGLAKRDYAGIDIDETEYTVTTGLEYIFSREVALLARYQHTAFLSDFADGDFESDEFRLALRLRR